MSSKTPRRMFRYEVAVDGGPAEVGLTGEPVAVAALAYSAGVEFWAEHDEAKEPRERTFTIVGTGHTIPAGARYIGTAPRTSEGLVWHLYEITADAPRPGDQPLPVPGHGPSMHDVVCEDLRRDHGDYPLTAAVIADLEARKQLGVQRYGRILQAGNGRDALLDLYEELQDAAVYCRQRVTEAAGTPEADVLIGTGDRLGGMLLVVRRLMDIRSAPR